MIAVEIRLFGAFRKYESQCMPLRISINKPATIAKIKKALAEKFHEMVLNFSDAQLITDSAMADDYRILPLEEIVDRSCVLSILPPVCGG